MDFRFALIVAYQFGHETDNVVREPPVTQIRIRRILRRMPRMQVYLPDDLFGLVKQQRLPVSELLQSAVRAEAKRRALIESLDDYLVELQQEVGVPTEQELASAQAMVDRLAADRAS